VRRGREMGAEDKQGAQDKTRLEPLVCFIFVFFLQVLFFTVLMTI
jgi:hypothetical protein